MPAPKASPWGFVGMGGLACVLFLDLLSVRVAPWWVTVLLVLVWLVLFVLGCRWFMPEPARVAWLALAGVVVWAAAVVPLVVTGA